MSDGTVSCEVPSGSIINPRALLPGKLLLADRRAELAGSRGEAGDRGFYRGDRLVSPGALHNAALWVLAALANLISGEREEELVRIADG